MGRPVEPARAVGKGGQVQEIGGAAKVGVEKAAAREVVAGSVLAMGTAAIEGGGTVVAEATAEATVGEGPGAVTVEVALAGAVEEGGMAVGPE